MARQAAVPVLLAFLVAGCSSTVTYRVSPPVLDGQEVRVATRIDDGILRTETSAGRYTVERVTLILADGSTLDPTFSATTHSASRRSGFRLGTGIGTGVGGGVGVGVGTSVPIGGAGRTVYSITREARWQAPPLDRQPFTLRATLATEPPTIVHVPLGRVTDTQPPDAADSSAPRVETWKLPDGAERRFRATSSPDDDAPPTYTPAE